VSQPKLKGSGASELCLFPWSESKILPQTKGSAENSAVGISPFSSSLACPLERVASPQEAL